MTVSLMGLEPKDSKDNPAPRGRNNPNRTMQTSAFQASFVSPRPWRKVLYSGYFLPEDITICTCIDSIIKKISEKIYDPSTKSIPSAFIIRGVLNGHITL